MFFTLAANHVHYREQIAKCHLNLLNIKTIFSTVYNFVGKKGLQLTLYVREEPLKNQMSVYLLFYSLVEATDSIIDSIIVSVVEAF